MFHNLRFPTNLRFGNTKVDGGVNQAHLEDQVDFVSKQHQQMPFQCFWMHTMCELAPTKNVSNLYRYVANHCYSNFSKFILKLTTSTN